MLLQLLLLLGHRLVLLIKLLKLKLVVTHFFLGQLLNFARIEWFAEKVWRELVAGSTKLIKT